MKYFNRILLIALILLFSGIIIKQSCKPDTKERIKIIEKVLYQDSFIIDTVFKPEYNFVKEKIYLHDTIIKFDTIFKIIEKYYTKNVYIDTVFNTDSIFLVITDTIHENKIKDRKTQITVFEQQKKEYNYLVASYYIRSSKNNLNTGINLMYEQQKNVFGGSIDKNSFLVSYGRKFRLKKRR